MAMAQPIQDETKIKLRPELELVLCSARAHRAANEDRIRELIRIGVNWNEVLAAASQHALLPILCKHFHRLDCDWITPDRRETLFELERHLGKNSMLLLGEMLRLNTVFEDTQVPAIPFKGPVLAWLAYQSFTLRTCMDLDFVVPQRYIPQAVCVLQAAGYSAQFDSSEVHVGERAHAPGQYAFVSRSNGVLVELHTERTLRYFPCPLKLDEMNLRLIELEIGGRKVRTFCVEDMLVMLSVHGAKHFWERIAWILDIARLITIQEVDWTLLLAIAARMESTRILLLGLCLAHDLFHATLPQSVLQDIAEDKQVQWLANTVRAQYLGISDPSAGVWPRAQFRLRSRDEFWQGLRHVMRLMMGPTESDRQVVRLPRLLAPLYMFVRPWRLMREYGFGLKRRFKPDLAIYQPTPQEIVNHMLRLAEISPGDVVYDLGCGDGRIVITAAEKYGIRGVGVDINRRRIAEARANARRHGVADLVEFHHDDAKNFDFADATVVTLFLGADANLRLVERLRAELSPGARIVSRDFLIHGWKPDRSESHTNPNGTPSEIYFWTIKDLER